MSNGHLYTSVNETVASTVLATGATTWRSSPNAPVGKYIVEADIDLAVANGVVVVSSTDCISQSSPSGYVYALNAATGALLWQASTSGGRAITVSGAYLIQAGGTETDVTTVTVYKMMTGAVVWQHNYDGYSCGPNADAIVEGGQVIVDVSNPRGPMACWT